MRAAPFLLATLVCAGCSDPYKPGAPMQTLTGTGDQTSATFHLEGGVAIVRAKLPTKDDRVTLDLRQMPEKKRVAGFDAKADGSKLLYVVPPIGGDFEVRVERGERGSWQVEVEQPRPKDAPATKLFYGADTDVVGPFTVADGYREFRFKGGPLGFSPKLYDGTGSQINGWFDGFGSEKGTAYRLSSSTYYWIAVEGGGPSWSVAID